MPRSRAPAACPRRGRGVARRQACAVRRATSRGSSSRRRGRLSRAGHPPVERLQPGEQARPNAPLQPAALLVGAAARSRRPKAASASPCACRSHWSRTFAACRHVAVATALRRTGSSRAPRRCTSAATAAPSTPTSVTSCPTGAAGAAPPSRNDNGQRRIAHGLRDSVTEGLDGLLRTCGELIGERDRRPIHTHGREHRDAGGYDELGAVRSLNGDRRLIGFEHVRDSRTAHHHGAERRGSSQRGAPSHSRQHHEHGSHDRAGQALGDRRNHRRQAHRCHDGRLPAARRPAFRCRQDRQYQGSPVEEFAVAPDPHEQRHITACQVAGEPEQTARRKERSRQALRSRTRGDHAAAGEAPASQQIR